MRLLDHLPRSKLAEGPLWDGESGSLYWVDIAGHAIHRHRPATGAVATHPLDAPVGFCAVAADGRLVAGIGDGLHDLAFGTPGTTPIVRPAMHGENRFNDGKCDASGRLWAGTMHVAADRDREPTGALYRWRGGGLDIVEWPVSLANGLGWSPTGDTMYFSDTHAGTVWAYDYDLDGGHVANRRTFATIPLADGVPDGLTVDSAGNVYVAIWRGARLDVFAPDGRRTAEIPVPVHNPTSCAFGGADLRTLYVTTMPAGNEDDPRSGSLFALDVAVPGQPSARMNRSL